MFDPKTTKIVKIRKKNVSGFLAMIFFTILIVSTGGSFGLRNFFAQAQVQTQQTPTFAYSLPWTNNLSTLNPHINSFQVLCRHGICDQSSDPNISDYGNPTRSLWTNNLSTLNPHINSFQVLCRHGICDQSSNPNISDHGNPTRSLWTNNIPTVNQQESRQHGWY
jgi:hypothetical protein